MNWLFFFLLIFSSSSSVAADSPYCLEALSKLEISKKQPGPTWRIGEQGIISGLVGDQDIEVQFLGRAVDQSRKSHFFLFFETQTGRIHVIPTNLSTQMGPTEEIYKPRHQRGETCFQEACFGALENMQIRHWNLTRVNAIQNTQNREMLFHDLGKNLVESQNRDIHGYLDQIENFKALFTKWKIPYSIVSHKNPNAVAQLIKHLEEGGLALIGYRIEVKNEPLKRVTWDHTGGSIDRTPSHFTKPFRNGGIGPGHVVLALNVIEGFGGNKNILIGDSQLGFYQIWSIDDLEAATTSSIDYFILLSK